MERIEEARIRVENTKDSYRAIAKDHGTSHTTLQKIVKEKKWNTSHRISKNSKTPQVSMPAHAAILGKIAVRKIEEIKDELGDKYSPVDEPLIVMYAKSYERYISLEKKMGLDVEGIIATSSKTGGIYLSPIFTATLAIQKNLVTIANQLGLSIASRKKLGIKFERPGQKQASIFDIVGELSKEDEDLDDI